MADGSGCLDPSHGKLPRLVPTTFGLNGRKLSEVSRQIPLVELSKELRSGGAIQADDPFNDLTFGHLHKPVGFYECRSEINAGGSTPGKASYRPADREGFKRRVRRPPNRQASQVIVR